VNAGKETFGVVAAQWLASRHELKLRTRVEYANLLSGRTRARRTGDGASTGDLSISATFDHRQVNQITRADIADWVGKLTVQTSQHRLSLIIISLCGRYFRNVSLTVDWPLTRPIT
jgi:hypothetical protein